VGPVASRRWTARGPRRLGWRGTGAAVIGRAADAPGALAPRADRSTTTRRRPRRRREPRRSGRRAASPIRWSSAPRRVSPGWGAPRPRPRPARFPAGGRASTRGARTLRARVYLAVGAPAGTPLVLLLHGYAAMVPTYEENQARPAAARRPARGPARPALPPRPPPGGCGGRGRLLSAAIRGAPRPACAQGHRGRRRRGRLGADEPRRPGGRASASAWVGWSPALLAANLPLYSVVAVTPPCDLADLVLRRSPPRTRRRLGLVDGRGGPWGDDPRRRPRRALRGDGAGDAATC